MHKNNFFFPLLFTGMLCITFSLSGADKMDWEMVAQYATFLDFSNQDLNPQTSVALWDLIQTSKARILLLDNNPRINDAADGSHHGIGIRSSTFSRSFSYINLQNCGVTKLPLHFGSEHFKIQTLILSKNPNIDWAHAITPTIEGWGGNGETIGLPPHLTSLDLTDCNLIEIPQAVKNLKKLQTLFVSKNANIRWMPDSLPQSVTTLVIEESRVANFIEAIKCSKVKTIYCAGTELDKSTKAALVDLQIDIKDENFDHSAWTKQRKDLALQ